MKPPGPLKHFFFAFVIAAVLYAISYFPIEHLRTRKGPWQVTFTNEATTPTLVINEPGLSIAQVKINFLGETAPTAATTLLFNPPQPVPFDVPFGQCIFEDTTFQPGTVVFKLFGHEIQLLPRVVTIDKKEYPWQSNTTRSLNKADISPGAP